MNIPIYRAKKVDSDEYLIGYLRYSYSACCHIIESKDNMTFFEIDKRVDMSTLSIHFPNMLDSSNKPMFASLETNGKGGDILDVKIAKNCVKPTRVGIFKYQYPFRFTIEDFDINAYFSLKVTGIKE